MTRSSSRLACFAVFLSAVLLSNACVSARDNDTTLLEADKAATAELDRLNSVLASNRPVTKIDIDSLNRLRDQYPSSPVVRRILQGALIKRGDWAAAEEIIASIPHRERANADKINLAKIYFKQGKFSEAVEILKPMLPDAAESGVEIWALLGQSQFYSGNLDEAAASLERVRDELVGQKRADDLAVLGTIYLRRGDHKKAIDVLQKAVEASPDNVAANNALSRAYAAIGDEANAQAYRSKVESISARIAADEKRKSRLVPLFYRLEDAYAAKDFDRVIAIVGEIQPDADDSTRPTLYQYLAAAYKAQGKETEAQKALAEAARLTQR